MILSESEKNRIKGLYGLVTEQQSQYDKILQKYVGKTILLYEDKNQKKLHLTNPLEIKDIAFHGGGIVIKGKTQFDWSLYPRCKYNPDEIDYELGFVYDTYTSIDKSGIVYNKKLVDSLNKDAKDNNINWCKKPQSDFGSIDKSDNSNFA